MHANILYKVKIVRKCGYCHYFGGTWAVMVTGTFGNNPPAEEQQMPSPTKPNPCAPFGVKGLEVSPMCMRWIVFGNKEW